MYSKTYTTEIVKVIAALGLIFGFDVDEQALTEVVMALTLVATTLYSLYLRYTGGGVTAFGFRK